MDSVTLVLSIYDALSAIRNDSLPTAIRDAAEQAILDVLRSVSNKKEAVSSRLNLLLKSVPRDHRVRTIAAVRHTMGYGLRDAKDFVDTVIGKDGYYSEHDGWVPPVTGISAVLTDTRDNVTSLSEQLKSMGCEVFVDDWGLRDPD
jgi:ribosomal protein L7/L12